MSIRLRLTLWYTAILFVALTTFAVVIYMGLDRSWRSDRDNTIGTRAREAAFFGIDRANQVAIAPPASVLDPYTFDGIYIEYVTTDGGNVSHSTNLKTAIVLGPADVKAIKDRRFTYLYVTTADGEKVRAFLYPLSYPSGSAPFGAVIAATPTAPLAHTLRKAQYLLAGGVVGATLLLALIVYAVARTGLRPIERMARDAAGIQAAQDLSRRVAVPRTGDEVARLGWTFNEMLGRLEAAFEAQRRFIADASHELRTPLTSIRGNADLLRQHSERMDRTERAEVLDDMAMEAERMSRLISDLLALARAQTGEQPKPTPVRFDEVADGAVRAGRGLARGHEVYFFPSSAPLWVMGDPDRLKQLALILLDNAIKYTPPDGHIWVSVRPAGAIAELRVVDDGPGIPADRLPYLFERFYRGGTLARGRDDGGAGLGLAIAREITQGFGGTIAVESTVGRGTAFTIQFPLLATAAHPDMADEHAGSVAAPIASVTRMTEN